MNSTPSTSSAAPHSIMHAPPQKDYEAAFGALQAQYGMGGLPTPPLPEKSAKTQKWYKWGRTESTVSLIGQTRGEDASTRGLSESERRFGKLMDEYGYGPMSQAHSNHS